MQPTFPHLNPMLKSLDDFKKSLSISNIVLGGGGGDNVCELRFINSVY